MQLPVIGINPAQPISRKLTKQINIPAQMGGSVAKTPIRYQPNYYPDRIK